MTASLIIYTFQPLELSLTPAWSCLIRLNAPPSVTFLSCHHVMCRCCSSPREHRQRIVQSVRVLAASVNEQLRAAAHPQTTSCWRRTADVLGGFEHSAPALYCLSVHCCFICYFHAVAATVLIKGKDFHTNTRTLTKMCTLWWQTYMMRI